MGEILRRNRRGGVEFCEYLLSSVSQLLQLIIIVVTIVVVIINSIVVI